MKNNVRAVRASSLFAIAKDNGDLPLHLLVRSGSATRATVELLIRPIIYNPTICAYPGSVGVHLPLHSESSISRVPFLDTISLFRSLIDPAIASDPCPVPLLILYAVAAEYRCSYKILEGLLTSYSDAARTQRQLLPQPLDGASSKNSVGSASRHQSKKGAPKFALEIFEEGRGMDEISLEMAAKNLETKLNSDPGSDSGSSTHMALGEAE